MAFTKLFQDGFRLIDGSYLNKIFNGQVTIPNQVVTAETVTTLTATNETVSGTLTVGNLVQSAGGQTSGAYQALTAAGSTQLGAAAITSSFAIVTVSTTASTHGVRLPTAATGLQVIVGNNGTFGVKVYPATNGKIGAAVTNAADSTVLAINKVNTYYAVNTTKWIVDRGS